MKPIPILKIFGVIAFTLLLTNLTAQVKIGEKPNQMDPSAILELDSAHLGLLITRVILTDEYDVSTIPNPAAGYHSTCKPIGRDDLLRWHHALMLFRRDMALPLVSL